ncbi:hypothetical protein FP744_10005086 [Trichoderma asperellum]
MALIIASLYSRAMTSVFTSVVFSEDGRFVAAGGDYNRVHYWDLALQDSESVAQPVKVLMQRGPEYDHLVGVHFRCKQPHCVLFASDLDLGHCDKPLNPTYPEYVVTGAGPILIEDIRESDEVRITPTEWCPCSFTSFDEDSAGSITWQGKEMIFLPKEERDILLEKMSSRKRVVRVRDRRVVVGRASGRVLFFRFREESRFDDSS